MRFANLISLGFLGVVFCDEANVVHHGECKPISTGVADFRACLKAAAPYVKATYPGLREYLEIMTPRNLLFALAPSKSYPAAVVRPTTTEEVRAVVDCARSRAYGKYQLNVYYDGYDLANYEIEASSPNTILIDMSASTHIWIDHKDHFARLGAGVTGHGFLESLALAGKAAALPFKGDMSIAASVQDGGFGWLGRGLGLACDNLLYAEVVTAEGKVVQAESFEDLYRIIRGGGRSNIGIVTEIVYKLHNAPILTSISVEYDIRHMSKVIQLFTQFVMSSTSLMTPVLRVVKIDGLRKVRFDAVFIGDTIEAEQHFRPFVNAMECPDAAVEYKTSYFAEIMNQVYEREAVIGSGEQGSHQGPSGKYSFQKALPVAFTESKPLSDQCIYHLIDEIQKFEIDNPLIFTARFEGWGNSEVIKPNNDREIKSAFTLRDLQINVLIQIESPLPIQADQILKVQTIWASLRRCSSDRVYVGYRARELGEDTRNPHTGEVEGYAPQASRAYHGPQADFLVATKTRYDPENAFWFPQALRRLTQKSQ